MPTPDIIASLQAQADHERLAATSYLALAFWCESANLTGFAEFFRKQSAEETEHTAKIHQHLLDRGVTPALGALPSPRQEFGDIHAVVGHALALEEANTRGIHAAYEAALAARDYPAQVLLHWFISEQVEEEAWAGALVAKTRQASCGGALVSLDRHIVKDFSD
jgi:ferritin